MWRFFFFYKNSILMYFFKNVFTTQERRMTMIGVPLSTYKEELKKIPPGVLPTRTIANFEERLKPYEKELLWEASRYDPGIFDPAKHCHALPDEFIESCTFEELAKIWVSHFIMLRNREVEKRFEKDPQ